MEEISNLTEVSAIPVVEVSSIPSDDIDTNACDIEDDLPCKVSVGTGMILNMTQAAAVAAPQLQAVADRIAREGRTTIREARAAFQEAVDQLTGDQQLDAKVIAHETFANLYPEVAPDQL